jgi:hypothetical protein
MERYAIIGSDNKVIGCVDAISGDVAWDITKAVQPEAVRLVRIG